MKNFRFFFFFSPFSVFVIYVLVSEVSEVKEVCKRQVWIVCMDVSAHHSFAQECEASGASRLQVCQTDAAFL